MKIECHTAQTYSAHSISGVFHRVFNGVSKLALLLALGSALPVPTRIATAPVSAILAAVCSGPNSVSPLLAKDASADLLTSRASTSVRSLNK